MTSFNQKVIAAGPEWYWRLDERSGFVAADVMGNGNLEYESDAGVAGYSIPSSQSDEQGAAKNINGDSSLQIFDPVDPAPPPSISDVFSIDLYDGTGIAQSIVTGIDLSANDGIVWFKDRDSATTNNLLFNTLRGATKNLLPSGTNSESTNATTLTAFNNDGFTVGVSSAVNRNTALMVAWTFKKQAKFFDVIEYSGDSVAGRTIAHSLGITPGFIMVKRITPTSNWSCQHISTGGTIAISFNSFFTPVTSSAFWDDTAFDSSDVTLGTDVTVNASGNDYMMFVFAHDPAASGLIQCGEYTGNGNIVGPEITLGWVPQYVLIREVVGANSGTFHCFDTARGIVNSGDDKVLVLSGIAGAGAEFDEPGIGLTSDGFQLQTTNTKLNESGATYIYMAVREE